MTTPRRNERQERKTRRRRHLPADAWSVENDAPEVEVEITPGKRVMARLPKSVPKYVVFGLTQDAETGEHKVEPVLWSQHLPMGQNLPRDLGLPVHANTFYRLIYTGHFRASKFSPNVLLVDVASILKHLKRTRIVPGQASFWTPERKRAFAEAQEGPGAQVQEKEDG